MRLGWVDLLYMVWGIFPFHEKYCGDAAGLLGGYIPPGFSPTIKIKILWAKYNCLLLLSSTPELLYTFISISLIFLPYTLHSYINCCLN